MSRTLLIVGQTEEKREEKAKTFFPKPLPHPDFIIIQPELSIGIAEIRDLKHLISLRPYSEDFKVVFIKKADRLTPEAQNAFLKTLEEPPNHTTIILSPISVESLLPTVISRCEIIKLEKIEDDKLIENDNGTQNLLGELRKNSLGEFFEYAAKSLSNREEVLNWIDTCQQSMRREYIGQLKAKQPLTLKNKEYIKIQECLTKAKKLIKQNVQSRFVMENFYLQIKPIFT